MRLKRSWLEIAECAFLVISAIGTIVAIASQQVAYTALPLTLTLFLNAVNRYRFQRQVRLHNRKTIAKVDQVAQSLQNHAQVLQGESINLSPITQSLKQLEYKIQMLTQQFDTRPELQETAQLESRLNALVLRLDNLPQAWEVFDLRAIEAEVVSLQVQLKTVDPIALNNSIAHLQSHINRLNQQLENLPPPFDPGELKQQLTQLQEGHNIVCEGVSGLVSAVVTLQSETAIAEQARVSQLDALMQQLENLS